jgi:hypothetical protein
LGGIKIPIQPTTNFFFVHKKSKKKKISEGLLLIGFAKKKGKNGIGC